MWDFLKSAKAKREARTASRGESLRSRRTDPLTPRHWHDRTQFYQSNVLEAAVLKRRRRATKLYTAACWSADNNRAHYDEFDNLHERLNPFYVAK